MDGLAYLLLFELVRDLALGSLGKRALHFSGGESCVLWIMEGEPGAGRRI